MGFNNRFDSIIREAIKQFPNVPMYIIKGVIQTESGFKERAYNPETSVPNDASRGLMQLLFKTAQGLGFRGTPEQLFLPSTNIYYGVKLLSDNFKRAGDWPRALSAYNGGFRPSLGFGEPINRAGVRCMGRVVPIGEFCNQSYVNKTLRNAAVFASEEGISQTALPFRNSPTSGNWECASIGTSSGNTSETKEVKMFGSGWKGKTGAIVTAIGSVLGALGEIGVTLPGPVANGWEFIIGLGVSLGIFGVRDALDKK